MKKLFIAFLSLLLIFTLSACRVYKTEGSDISPDDSSYQSELPDEDISEETDEKNSKEDIKDGKRGYEAYKDANNAFDEYVMEKSKEVEVVMYNSAIVITPESKVLDYITPLMYWGETLEDDEIATKEMMLGFIAGEGKSLKSADLQRESENRYTMTMETKKGEQILAKVEYYPDIDALRLVAESSTEPDMFFEYVKTADGYAAQYYFNHVVGGSYNEEPIKAMCNYKIIFSEKEGIYARFDDVEEPASFLDGLPGEKEFVDGATHWFVLKNGKFTGELDGTAF